MLIHILVPVLAALAIFLIGGAALMAQSARRARIAARLAMAGSVETANPLEGSALVRAVGRLGHVTSSGKTSRTLREDLARAGFHNKNAGATYVGAKVLLFVMGLFLSIVVVTLTNMSPRTGLLLSVMTAGIFFCIPNIYVSARRRQRMLEISLHLPDAIDLLEISVTAGMGIDQAWNAVTDEVRSVCVTLADEMALTNLEIHLGATRAVSMRHMAERTGAAELNSLVACMVQAERFGTSMRDALRNFAVSMREARSHRAQERAERIPVKMIFPMIVLIFGPFVMVVAGPAILTIFRIFRGLGNN